MSLRSFRRNHARALENAERRNRRARIATGASIVAGSAVFAPAAGAATFTVDTLADPGNGDTCAATDCSLREAVTDADGNPGSDTIRFASGLSGEITLGIPLSVTSPDGLAIQGPGVSVVSISGDTNTNDVNDGGDIPILVVGNDAAIDISGLTLTEGFNNSASRYGGAITINSGADVTLTDAALTANATTSYGGGAILNGGDLTLTRTELSGNTGNGFGGAILSEGTKYGSPADPATTTTITNSTITDNGAFLGGGIATLGAKYGTSGDPNPAKGKLTITGTTISGNDASIGAGVFAKYGQTSITGGAIDDNTVDQAGAVALTGGDTTITGTTISGNDAGSAGSGGNSALSTSKYARLDLSDSTITGNSTTGSGTVGIYAADNAPSSKYATPPNGRVDIARTTIAGNLATYEAGLTVGGIPAGSSVHVRDTTISGNVGGPDAIGGGVGLYGNVDGDVLVSNTTISGNSAGYGGGVGIGVPYATAPTTQVDDNGALTIQNSTIAGNTATTAGGGIYLGGYSSDPATMGSPSKSADVPVSSTIVADNTAGGSANDLAAATVDQPGKFQLGGSLVETPGSAPVNQTPAGSDILGTDPQLGPLADNGGPTKTLLPAKTSPVIDKGVANGLTTDQRGQARTNGGGTDIGSVEIPAPDTTPPVIEITKKPKGKLGTRKGKRRVRIGFKSNEPGSAFEYAINGGDFQPTDRPFKRKLKAKPGKGAKYVIQIRATDPAGNVGQAVKVKTRVIHKG